MNRLLPSLLLACAPLALAQPAQPDPFASIAWLAGCWAPQGQATVSAGSAEQWMAPAGGLMLGMARTLKNGRVVEFEFMQIRAGADGRLSFIAQPQGRPPTEFGLLRQGEAEAVFENPAHDFPQRVIYRLAAPDRLVARIEGVAHGKARGIDFPMQRSACGG